MKTPILAQVKELHEAGHYAEVIASQLGISHDVVKSIILYLTKTEI